MKKTLGKLKKLTRCTFAFLIVALVFLAVGLGTLGSGRTTGSAYELKAKKGDSTASVVINLTTSVTENVKENGQTTPRTYSLRITDVYVNLGVIYAEAGTPAQLRLEYGSSGDRDSFTSSIRRIDATFENFYTTETETASDTVESALFRWVKPYQSAMENWTGSTSSYHYVKLTALTHNILVNEVVFVAEKYYNSVGTGEYCVMPASISWATPNSDESTEEAIIRAEALIDAQSIPSTVQSSYYAYSDDELYTLSTIAELERGGEYDSSIGSAGYHVEGVYGPLGVDLIVLGTKIFGTSPFGLRFFPFLASFGVLLLGYFLVKRISRSEKAALVFAVLYALCNLSFALGHLGNPLMLGVFFFVASFALCHRFYACGMRKANLAGALPPIFSGLFGAAAIAVNGAYLIPMLGVVALFVVGMVRQQKARRHKLDLALSDTESTEEGTVRIRSEAEKREAAAKVVEEYRMKNAAAPVGFGISLIFGSVLLIILCAIPLYSPYVLLFTTSSSANIFLLAAHAFAGGFTGVNAGATHSAWDLFYILFRGTGERVAVTAAAVNAVAAVAGLLGVLFAAWRIAGILRTKKLGKEFGKEFGKEQRSELRKTVIPLVGLILSLITSAFGGGALGFVMLAYVFAFVLAGNAIGTLTEGDGKLAKTARICMWMGLGLLLAVFALYAVFTFSIPLSAGLVTKLIG